MKATVRTIVIYDRTKIQPQTIRAIAAAKDGEWVPVGREEFNGFYQLHIFQSEIDKLVRSPGGKGKPAKE